MIDMNKVKEFVRKNFDNLNYYHTLDVVRLSLELAGREGADKEVVEAAAWLHDIGKIEKSAKGGDHHLFSMKIAEKLLKEIGADAGFIKRVCKCVEEHMGPPSKKLSKLFAEAGIKPKEVPRPSTIESKCLYDADMINFLGPYGIAKVIHLNASKGREFREAMKERMRQTEEAYNDLQTESGRKMAEEYYDIAKKFFGKIVLEE